MLKKIILILICSLSFIALICFVLNIKSDEQIVNNNEKKNTVSEKKAEKEEIEELKTMTEKKRIKRYLTKYMEYVELGEYEKAYAVLYPDFKQNYFKELTPFVEYIKKLYPSTIIVEYEEMQRQGYYFVLYLKIIDPLGEKETIKQKFVIYEKDYNDYALSFEVI